jgi:hypothetical protein
VKFMVWATMDVRAGADEVEKFHDPAGNKILVSSQRNLLNNVSLTVHLSITQHLIWSLTESYDTRCCVNTI